MLTILQAETPQQLTVARELMYAYAEWLEYKLCFQGFEEEMRSLPGSYAPPQGCLLLALWSGAPAGVVALRPLAQNGWCEMRRLFVRPEFRGKSIARQLTEHLLAKARSAGHQLLQLETIPGKMDSAINLYRSLGFTDRASEATTPGGPEVLEMELRLDRSHTSKASQRAARSS